MLRLAEVEIGAAFEADTAAIIEKRLRATGKFQKSRGAEAVCVDRRSVEDFRRHRGRRGRREDRMGPGFGRRAAHRQAPRAWSDVPADPRRAGRVRLDLRRALCGAERGRLAEPRRLSAHLGRRQARGRAVREGLRHEARSIASPGACPSPGASTRSTNATTIGCGCRRGWSAICCRSFEPGQRSAPNTCGSWPTTPGSCRPAPTSCSTRVSIPCSRAMPFTPAPPGTATRSRERTRTIRYSVDLRGYAGLIGQSVLVGRRVPERVRPAAAAVSAADPRRHGQPARVQGRLRCGRYARRRFRRSANADHVAAEYREARRQRVRGCGNRL